MYRVAERQYLPLSFSKMLSYLYQKTKYRQTLATLSDLKVTFTIYIISAYRSSITLRKT